MNSIFRKLFKNDHEMRKAQHDVVWRFIGRVTDPVMVKLCWLYMYTDLEEPDIRKQMGCSQEKLDLTRELISCDLLLMGIVIRE